MDSSNGINTNINTNNPDGNMSQPFDWPTRNTGQLNSNNDGDQSTFLIPELSMEEIEQLTAEAEFQQMRDDAQVRTLGGVPSADVDMVLNENRIVLENAETGEELRDTIVMNEAEMAWVGTFSNPAGVIEMAERFAVAHPDAAVQIFISRNNIRSESGEIRPVMPFQDLHRLGLNSAPYIPLCANCDKYGHVLGDCVWPYDQIFGDIHGCPLCNTKDHNFDHCLNLTRMTDDAKFDALVLRRAGKCMIRSDLPIYTMAVQRIQEGKIPDLSTFMMPWSRPGALRTISNPEKVHMLEAWNYSPDPCRPVMPDSDVSTNKLHELSKVDSGSFEQFNREQAASAESGVLNSPPVVDTHSP